MLDDLARRIRHRLQSIPTRPVIGTIARVSGTVVETAIDGLRVGELCRLRDPADGREGLAEVIGLGHSAAILVPIGGVAGLSTRTEVIPTGGAMRVRVGPGLIGRVLDGFGRPLDGRPPLEGGCLRPVDAAPPDALTRQVIKSPLPTGVRVIDGLLTCGVGQRIGIFGEPGGGKSSLLACLVKGAEVDVGVIALIGERGREVREFIERDLGPAGMARAVVVVATSDRPALERFKAAQVATAIAEFFRDEGKRVLLVMDSVTRLARAQREIGLAAGEPPTRRGYPPSVFAMMPGLLERSGPGAVGSITGFFTVLLEGDDTQDPVAEEVKSILDGHIILSAKLARAEHYPAIDVLRSRSRVMSHVVPKPHQAAAAKLRELIARYDEIELLIRVGEYRPGGDAVADEAVRKIGGINAFLKQGMDERASWSGAIARLQELAA
jgi:ATP synthase in type III secretion protein N